MPEEIRLALANKAAIITGAASGIGHAIARRFLDDGAQVVLADVNADSLSRAHRELDKGARSISYAGDVSLQLQAHGLTDACLNAFGKVDILVNCAGIARLSHFLDQGLDDWNRIMAVNLTGALLCGQSAARAMIAGGSGGRIVNISSVSGFQAGTGRAAYGTSKAAIIQLTRQMALDLGPHGITANAVAPGPVDTPMVVANHTAGTRRAFTQRIPLGRYGRPEEIAAVVAFLARDDASYITGQTLSVDGGFTTTGIVEDET